MSEQPQERYASEAVTPLYLGRVLKSLRKEAGLTQAELAEKVGVSRWWLSAAENGKPTVEVGKVMVLLHHLGHKMAVLPVGTAGRITELSPSGGLVR